MNVTTETPTSLNQILAVGFGLGSYTAAPTEDEVVRIADLSKNSILTSTSNYGFSPI